MRKPKHQSLHRGLHTYRLASNPDEAKLAKAWAKLNEGNYPLLGYLLSIDNRCEDFSERDAAVAATIIQWIGTPVGKEFIETLGYARK